MHTKIIEKTTNRKIFVILLNFKCVPLLNFLFKFLRKIKYFSYQMQSSVGFKKSKFCITLKYHVKCICTVR